MHRQHPIEPRPLQHATVVGSHSDMTTKNRIRLKCIVLGAAGAGKTSILRRYFSGTFQHGSRNPTLGADFYSGRVANPVYNALQGNDHKDRQEEHEDEDLLDQCHEQREQQQTTKCKPRNPKDTIWIEPIASQPTVMIQVWDTAGKERSIPQHQQDDYAKSKKCSAADLGDTFFRNADVALLVYDVTSSTSFTHLLKWYAELHNRMILARSNHDHGRHHQHNPTRHHAAKSSSTFPVSFPVIIVGNKTDKLLQRNDQKHNDTIKNNKNNTRLIANGHCNNRRQQQQQLLRRHHHHQLQQHQPQRQLPQPTVVPQRDVLGLKGQYHGKNYRYEYRVTVAPTSLSLPDHYPQPPPCNSCHHHPENDTQQRLPLQKNRLSPPPPPTTTTTYMATGETWTTDGSYLHALLNTEDGSFPDRELVLLWCQRNGLKHFDVSALEGTGIDAVMDEMVAQALESRNQQELMLLLQAEAEQKLKDDDEEVVVEEEEDKVLLGQSLPPCEPTNTNLNHSQDGSISCNQPLPPLQTSSVSSSLVLDTPTQQLRRNQALDLHARYSPQEEHCCQLFPWCRKK